MSWRERMGPASFRGVPFFVDTSERTGGRRGVTHEYPFRDEPFREDTGRATRGFTLEGYVLGEEYLAAKEALINALEALGPGTLVHPYYKTLTVAVEGFRVRESARDGGVATFSIEFEQTPESPAQPTSAPDVTSNVREAADSARDAVGAEFLARYEPGLRMETIADMPRRLTVAINSALAAVDREVQAAAAMQQSLDELVDGATALVNSPSGILASLVSLFGELTDRTAGLAAYAFDPGVRPPSTTSNRLVEQENFDALSVLVQRLAVIRAVEIAIEETFESFEAAGAARDELADLLDDQTETASDATYAALLDLRAALVAAVPDEGSDLPHLVPYVPAETVPSLVLAYTLYGDVTAESDILTRNRVKHPAFIVGSRALEVLSDA